MYDVTGDFYLKNAVLLNFLLFEDFIDFAVLQKY